MATNEKAPATLTIDGVKYDVASLSKEARAGIGNLAAIDAELKRLQVQVNIARVARAAVAAQLKNQLPKAA